jgi:hypothetical protein
LETRVITSVAVMAAALFGYNASATDAVNATWRTPPTKYGTMLARLASEKIDAPSAPSPAKLSDMHRMPPVDRKSFRRGETLAESCESQ